MKTWIIITSIAVLLSLLCTFFGIGTWHMAYEEATFQGALKEAKAIEDSKSLCKVFLGEILSKQTEHLKLIKNNCVGKRKVNIGVIGLSIYGLHIVKEAVADMNQDNLSWYHFEVITSLQSNKSLADQAQELCQLLDVKVFVGPETESDLKQLLVWARTRPQPSSLITIIVPAIITDEADLERRDGDNHTVVQIRIPQLDHLKAALYQINQRKIHNVLMLATPVESSSVPHIQRLENLTGVKITIVNSEEATHIPSLLESLEAELRILRENTQGAVGLLITQDYMFEQLLSKPIDRSLIFSIPWFTTAEEVLYKSSFLELELHKMDLDISCTLPLGNFAKNLHWRQNVSRRLEENEDTGLSSISGRDYISILLEHVYDSVIIAMHIGSWLTHQEIDIDILAKRVSWESMTWTGMSGLLKINKNFQRDHIHYLDLHLSRNVSGQFVQYPSGIWQVVGHTDLLE